MYAIVEIAGQQFKVEEKKDIYVHRLREETGTKVEFSDVLLIEDKDKVHVGQPFVNGACVKAKIIEHIKGDKIIVFKKKRRKGYQVKNGHRQLFSKISIEKIQLKSSSGKAKRVSSETQDTGKKKPVAKGAEAGQAKTAAKKPAASGTKQKSNTKKPLVPENAAEHKTEPKQKKEEKSRGEGKEEKK